MRDTIQAPVYLLPGNHDRWKPFVGKSSLRTLVRLGFDPGGKDFHEVFGEFWSKDVDVWKIPAEKNGFTVEIVAADLSLKRLKDCKRPRIKNKLGQGKVYTEILKDIEGATRGVQREGGTKNIVALWAVHFPPFYPGVSSYLKLLLENYLVRKAREFGVLAILAGHTHEALPYITQHKTLAADERVQVFCAGSATENLPPTSNQCYLISLQDIGAGCQVSLENYELDDLQGKFIRKPLPGSAASVATDL